MRLAAIRRSVLSTQPPMLAPKRTETPDVRRPYTLTSMSEVGCRGERCGAGMSEHGHPPAERQWPCSSGGRAVVAAAAGAAATHPQHDEADSKLPATLAPC